MTAPLLASTLDATAPTASALLVLGFMLGLRHATDADHVVAVATIVARERTVRAAGAIGVAWGIGHAVTVCLVGALIIGAGLVVPPRFEQVAEAAVGAMLVALGLVALAGALRGGAAPTVVPPEASAGSRGWLRGRAMLIGVVHGLAGSAGVTLLILPTMRAPIDGAAYLALFGVGTIVGMLALTLTMSLPLALRWRGAHRLGALATWLAAATSIITGGLILRSALT